jgi:hypothetical protein
MAEEKIDTENILRGTTMFSNDELKAWYKATPVDLDWLEKPSRHQFRWRLPNDRWVTLPRQISNEETLRKQFATYAPRDLYIGTSAWLNPVDLPRLKDLDVPAPILLDHLVVFDIDFRPFCYRRLERARAVTSGLLKWLDEHEDLTLQYISYSGGKGFHLVLKDNDRSLFATPEPRLREERVRASRQALLQRVLDAGFEVDTTVTADTRRIIRLPGSLHGTTGWCCTRISRKQLNQPLKTWKKTLPKHIRGLKMKHWPMGIKEFRQRISSRMTRPFKRTSTPKHIQAKITRNLPESVSMQMSSQVIGTKGRSSLMAWIPERWREGQREFFIKSVTEKGWFPIYRFQQGPHEFILIPRAIPTSQLRKQLPKLGLQRLSSEIVSLGHYWTDMSHHQPEMTEQNSELIFKGRWDETNDAVSNVPWSATHIEALKRLGVEVSARGEIAGRPEPAMRIVTKL